MLGELAALVAAAPSLAFAAHMCWIESVVEAPDGIELLFDQKAPLHIIVRGASKAAEGYRLLVKKGDMIYVSQVAEDSCVITIEEDQAGRLGALAEAHMHLAGMPPMENREFILAVETDAPSK